ncbi:MAG TPA: hypothetical protein VEL76_42525 [Gemmataceae bacterium]|nr:hypothetical protein [Gemmataceae bacterium]
MKRLLITAVLLLAQTGCLAPFTRRLDRAIQALDDIQVQMKVGNAKLTEATEAMRRMELQLEDANRKLATFERFMKRFGGGGVGRDGQQEGATAAPPEGPPQAQAVELPR